MLGRKIATDIEAYFRENSNKMLIVDGARQVGKSYIKSTSACKKQKKQMAHIDEK